MSIYQNNGYSPVHHGPYSSTFDGVSNLPNGFPQYSSTPEFYGKNDIYSRSFNNLDVRPFPFRLDISTISNMSLFYVNADKEAVQMKSTYTDNKPGGPNFIFFKTDGNLAIQAGSVRLPTKCIHEYNTDTSKPGFYLVFENKAGDDYNIVAKQSPTVGLDGYSKNVIGKILYSDSSDVLVRMYPTTSVVL